MSQMELCRPCLEILKKEGHKLTLTKGGSNNKVTCVRCGKRRFGAIYAEQEGK